MSTRRSFSVSGLTYYRVRQFVEANGGTMSGFLEDLIEERIGPPSDQIRKDYARFKTERKYQGLSPESLAIRQAVQEKTSESANQSNSLRQDLAITFADTSLDPTLAPSEKNSEELASVRVVQISLPDLTSSRAFVTALASSQAVPVVPKPTERPVAVTEAPVTSSTPMVEKVVRPRPHHPGVPAPSPVPREMFAKEEPEDKEYTPANLLL